MKDASCAVVALLLCTIVSASPVSPQGGQETPGRDSTFEQEIYDRLARIDPDAVPIFQNATCEMDSGNWEAAKRDYEKVLEMAPDFPDAARRLSYVELGLEDVRSALAHAERAFAVDPSPYNELALARSLLATEDSSKFADALGHAKAAAGVLPQDLDAQMVLLSAGVLDQDLESIRQASAKLVVIAPDFPWGHFYAGLVAAEEGKWEKAESELLLSQALGVPAEHVQSVLADGISSQARIHRWLRRGGYTLGGWLTGLATLFLVGLLLSGWTLKTVIRPQRADQFEISGGEHAVRTVYRVVIAITSLYFYLSIPLLIAIVIAITGGIFYLFLLVGRIPLRLAFIIGATALFTLVAIVRSVFARIKETDPGRLLTREEAPALWSLTDEAGQRLQTRPIDAVYITPGSEIAVLERGGMWRKLRGKGQRCLILGLGALSGLSQSQFRAILAHEYGHFSNRDTAGGNLAIQVHYAIHQMALRLAINGLARWHNPAWLFINGFNRVFLRITLGASRLQEILADRYAALAYGVKNLKDGLTNIIRQSLVFEMQIADEVKSAQEQRRGLQNVYDLPPVQVSNQQELEEKITEVMSRPTSPYDSHPVPMKRISLLEQLDSTDPSEVNLVPLWDLLPNAQALQAEMTDVIQANLRQQEAMLRQLHQ